MAQAATQQSPRQGSFMSLDKNPPPPSLSLKSSHQKHTEPAQPGQISPSSLNTDLPFSQLVFLCLVGSE